MIIDNDLVVLDLEATGTWREKDRIIEIAMIRCFPDGSNAEYCKRVNPEISIPAEVVEITGITDADVKDAPTFKQIAREIVDFIGNSDLTGFNIEKFDVPMLKRQLDECGIQFDLTNRFIYDAQKIYHLHHKRDLTAAYLLYCNKNLIGAHGALADTQASLEVLREQIRRYSQDGHIKSLKEFQYEKPNDFFDDDRKFRWWGGELYITFGKHNGKSMRQIAKDDRAYLEWILGADFSAQIKSMIKSVLNGEHPVK